MKKYSVDLSFDPPFMNHEYVYMTLESSDLVSLKWMLEAIQTSEIHYNCFMIYPIEEEEVEELPLK